MIHTCRIRFIKGLVGPGPGPEMYSIPNLEVRSKGPECETGVT